MVVLLDNAGAVTRTYAYDANGKQRGAFNHSDKNPFRYNGQYCVPEMGIYYLRARWYDPRDGQFLTMDPAKDGENWYAYCRENPVKFVDPSGLKIEISEPEEPERDDFETEQEYQAAVANYNKAMSEHNENVKQYNRAIAYLKTSTTAKSLIERLENAEEVFNVIFKRVLQKEL